MADSADFKQAAQAVRNLKGTPSNEDYARMYSLFKQATDGDCSRASPDAADALEKAKHDAWTGRKGMSQAEAAQQYVTLSKEAISKYGQK